MTSSGVGGYFELDPNTGWRAASMEGLSPVDGGALAVDCAPGQPERFAASWSDRFRYPVALARDPAGEAIYLLDDAVHRIKALELGAEGAIIGVEPIRGVGGRGRRARQLRSARGLARLSDGSIVVADTGNHQVKLFSTFPHALLSVWGTGRPGSDANAFNSPWKVVADPCGLIYVADRDNGRIQRVRRDTKWEAPIGGLHHPTALALHTDRTLVVLDDRGIHAFAENETTTRQTLSVVGATCLTFDDRGYLYVGTSTGLVYKFAPNGVASFREAVIGVTGSDARFIDLVWTPDTELVGILLERCAPNPTLQRLSTCGAYVSSGRLTTNALDSGIEACVWHRIELDASVPPGTVIDVSTRTSDGNGWTQASTLSLTGENPDCLVQSRAGRRLEVTLRLKTNGVATPVVRALRVHYPRQSYLEHLPAIYQEDAESRVFLGRFLSIFQTTFDAIDDQIDDVWMLFDPASVPEKWYPWLATWLALPINPLWSDSQRRAALKHAGRGYPQRGTPAGLQALIKEYADVDARLVEHYRLRQLLILPDQPPTPPDAPTSVLGTGGRLWSRDFYQRLQLGVYSRIGYFRLAGAPEPGIEAIAWGANEFTVLFDADPYDVEETQKKVMDVVEREKPAHTRAHYSPVLPRMRVGVQATLGVDTRVGDITPLLLGTTGILGYDSILGCSRDETRLRSQGATVRPQVSVNTRLL
jgi:phage tail-like protein